MSKKKNKKPVSHRFVELEFPTDIYGLTSEMKRIFISTARRLHGDPQKKAVFDETLQILQEYADVKYEHDHENRFREADIAPEPKATGTVPEGTSLEDQLFGDD